MANQAHLGYARAFVRGPSLDWQYGLLRSAEVLDRHTYTDSVPGKRVESRKMFGQIIVALRCGDLLVVPNLAVFARSAPELISSMDGLRAHSVFFLSVEDEIDTRQEDPELFFKFGTALSRADRIWKRERSINGCKAAQRSRRTGRRPTLTEKRREVGRLLWLDPEERRTNEELAKEIGLSASRCWQIFGARGRA